MAQKWPKMTHNGQKMTQNCPNGPKMTQNGPKISTSWKKNSRDISAASETFCISGGEMSTALDGPFFVGIICHLWQRAWWIAKEMRFCSVTQKFRRCRKMPLKGTGWTFKLIYATSKMVTATMIVLGLSGLVGAGHHHSYHHHKRSPHIRECQL